eukprot:SAG22_NODE_3226_length_1845_cov_2.332188_4_plen_76_part_01
MNVTYGPAELDYCGVCDADPLNNCVADCFGVWGGNLTLDECGCGGASTCLLSCPFSPPFFFIHSFLPSLSVSVSVS